MHVKSMLRVQNNTAGIHTPRTKHDSQTVHLLSRTNENIALLCLRGQRSEVTLWHFQVQMAPFLLCWPLTLTLVYWIWFLCEICSQTGVKVLRMEYCIVFTSLCIGTANKSKYHKKIYLKTSCKLATLCELSVNYKHPFCNSASFVVCVFFTQTWPLLHLMLKPPLSAPQVVFVCFHGSSALKSRNNTTFLF